ncbi:Uncharacterised protein [Escherichia coli]|uniref:Uncharacterized protein n=1 Tax=Escherichia coli TaxID=562 RepID=A0A376ZGY0_ECOLX|nr:Uncharacterised protein [Escherichia coli]
MRIAKIGVIALFCLWRSAELVASCSQVIPLFCVLAKRLHQPFKQAVCDDRRQCHQ